MSQLASSYQYCKKVTRRASSTFYLASLMFAKQTRLDLSAIYAFCRTADDIADAPGLSHQERANELALLRHALRTERYSEGDNLWPAFFDVVKRHKLKKSYFEELLDGVEGDIKPFQIKTVKDLEKYSYLVAGTVGLMCAHILGATKTSSLQGAKKLGIAMQITNILRDVSADAAISRVYIPSDLLKEYNLSPNDIVAGVYNSQSQQTFSDLAKLAQGYYDQAEVVIVDLPLKNRRAVRIATRLYRSILVRIEQKHFNVYNKRIRLNALQKLIIVLSTR